MVMSQKGLLARWTRMYTMTILLLVNDSARFSLATATTASPTTRTACFGSAFNASCPPGSVIMINNATYSRREPHNCVKSSGPRVECSTDARSYVEWKCAGRRSCTMLVDFDLHTAYRGCLGDVFGFLDVTFNCLIVFDNTSAECKGNILDVTSPSGYLSSAVTTDSGRGSPNCPWVIRVSGSQAINMTLIDLEVWPNREVEKGSCQIYAKIWIGRDVNPLLACSGTVRQTMLHSSVGRKDIRVAIFNNSGSFLIHFQVRRVADCDEYTPKSDYEKVVDRTNSSVLRVACARARHEHEHRSWTMVCSDGLWVVGDGTKREQCGDDASDGGYSTVNTPINESKELPVNASLQGILISMGAALTITMLAIASGIFYYIRRKSRFGAVISEHSVNAMYPYNGPAMLTYSQNTLSGRIATLPPNMPHARSQRDLMCGCAASTLHWTPRGAPGNYSTTLDMRRINNIHPLKDYGYTGCCDSQHPQQLETWTNCLGHDFSNTGTYGRRNHVNHIYDLPDALFEDRPAEEGALQRVAIENPAADAGLPTSPFYHELDPMLLNFNNAAGETNGTSSTTPFARI